METGVSSLLSGVVTSLNGSITDALPLAGGVFATLAGVMIGIKLFKKITGAKA
jgi:hypothetical protein